MVDAAPGDAPVDEAKTALGPIADELRSLMWSLSDVLRPEWRHPDRVKRWHALIDQATTPQVCAPSGFWALNPCLGPTVQSSSHTSVGVLGLPCNETMQSVQALPSCGETAPSSLERPMHVHPDVCGDWEGQADWKEQAASISRSDHLREKGPPQTRNQKATDKFLVGGCRS